MRRYLHFWCCAVLISLAVVQLNAFTLLGPFAPWQTPRLGYNDPVNAPGDINGGPMNLGEGYRWGVPTIYYAYSPDFLNYFGKTAADEIDKAIAVINALPSMDTVDVNAYPLQSLRMNYRASALNLYDIKSVALSWVVHNLGLTDPTRYVFTLRTRATTAASTNYVVIKRNFDPVTFEPSSFINGQLWTYSTIFEGPNQGADTITINEPVDPLALGGLINAPVTWTVGNNNIIPFGGFWTGLTRDDVGGIKYLYRSLNLAVETTPPNASLFVRGTTVLTTPGSSGSSSPWTIPIYPSVGTGTGTGTTGTGTGVGTTATGNTNVISTAVRPGVAKVNFVRVNYDSFVGTFPSNQVSYTDRYITNGTAFSQQVVRPLQAPDFLFDAQDIVGGDSSALFLLNQVTLPFTSNDAINGQTGTDGPGVIQPTGTATPAVVVVFNKVGVAGENTIAGPVFFLNEAGSFPDFSWGSFDGSTNAPIVYPNGTSIEDLEKQVLGGGASGAGGVGGGTSLVSPWTSAVSLIPASAITTGGGTTGGTTGGTGSTGGGGGSGGIGGTGAGSGGLGGTGISIIANAPNGGTSP